MKIEDLFLKTEHGFFLPEYAYDEYLFNPETGGFCYKNLIIHKTAEEVYQEYLHQLKDPTPEPTSEIEVLKSDIDFNKMVTETQQSEIDFLKLMGGI